MRLLTEDVIAIRDCLAAIDPPGVQPKPTIGDPRLALINHKRKGDELVKRVTRFSQYGATGEDEAVAERWTNSVIDFLSTTGETSALERFMLAGSGASTDRMADRLTVLQQLIDEMAGQR